MPAGRPFTEIHKFIQDIDYRFVIELIGVWLILNVGYWLVI